MASRPKNCTWAPDAVHTFVTIQFHPPKLRIPVVVLYALCRKNIRSGFGVNDEAAFRMNYSLWLEEELGNRTVTRKIWKPTTAAVIQLSRLASP
jgi:phytoene/squalene synthetase